MLPKISLLEELRKGGYESSLITTFNAYLPFYEDVVLRRLLNAGVRHNVLMMDARQYAEAFASHPPRLAGRQYTLMPINVPGAFHPKLIFLAGKRKGLLLVGSHNVTLAGFGFNRELTNLVRIESPEDTKGVALTSTIWAEIEYWLANFSEGVPDHVTHMVRRVADFAPWLKAKDEGRADADIKILAARPGGQAVWGQLVDLLDGKTAEVSLGGAFFDRELRFLKRVKRDLQPSRFTVAVDPDTVQMPPQASRTIAGVSFVCADALGAEDGEAAETRRYLHAKGILVEQEDGGAVFASGSANPSAPAWLSSEGGGNIELMLAYRGERALATAREMGYTRIKDMPLLTEDDWQAISATAEQAEDSVTPGYRMGLGVVEDTRIMVEKTILHGLDKAKFLLCDPGGAEIGRADQAHTTGDHGVVEFPAGTDLTKSAVLLVTVRGAVILKLLLHHAHTLEEQARTGTQRRFKEALLSLETDTPNIGLLIDCLDKIVGSEVQPRGRARGATVGAGEESASSSQETPDTLAIDVSDVKQRKSKKRLTHSGDFAYLLDTLIYHLRMQEDRVIEARDRFGRSEEEQIGAEDGSEADGNVQVDHQRQKALLEVCHARVGTVINRMSAQLSAYAKGDQSLENVLVRLLAVLAVLRELRSCDGRVVWVETGATSVPVKHRLRLLDEIMFTLFEGPSSLLHLEALRSEFQHSDDVARLKGLVLWLAWDCGLTLDLQKPFMESRKELDARLRRNAGVLALAQMIQSDDIVVDEARQSIGSLTSSELDWLEDVQRLASACDSLRQDSSVWQSASAAEPGDIALHRSIDGWDLQVVASNGGNNVSLVSLSKDQKPRVYATCYLAVARLRLSKPAPADYRRAVRGISRRLADQV